MAVGGLAGKCGVPRQLIDGMGHTPSSVRTPVCRPQRDDNSRAWRKSGLCRFPSVILWVGERLCLKFSSSCSGH